ncbi:hypothetical protein [Thermodesulfovibrio yellowstonii]|uniref:hypothetical protein n=1 Tax=Thermodesulfovibrio yellowstonii TaxID=28262 RepID=UPI0024B36AEF|nr:hypothetical protein [Thermodesulfovibrio yellowstonii]MDI6865808.1 hypothetical protein [Thermodesulfovibrio yellowstonii]
MIKLSNGKTATFREAKGKDLFEALRLASEPGEITKLLLARVLEIDGNPITENELEELPLEDVLLIVDAFGEKYPLSRVRQTSFASSEKASATKK